ncbi:MAG: selenocysteine-specific translation elongation factor [Gemmatimonadetes bacterium]|nr:selenocysteine-specific translation elongation factor [Gemmatimonadota bacterium]
MRRLILGTAGHIDHGKTALVRALTGTDTDRLPEEKRRGITIDLGFASLDLDGGFHIGIVDVPGHEAFIRNMLAGATGIDLALLVVAADESVMPQTREHLAILQFLGVPQLIVAVTKADLVESDWLVLVQDEIASALSATPWPDAPIQPVSVVDGRGLDALRDLLAKGAAQVAEPSHDDLFRLPIDRVFTVRGTGTVVTGTVWSGSAARDAQLRILPAGLSARVRGIQSHGRETERAFAGERAAFALAGADRETLARGDVLLDADGWETAHMLTVRATVANGAPPLRMRQRIRFHLGTAEVIGRMVVLDGWQIEPGGTGWAQLRLEQPVVARAGDRFVLRSYSPVTTIAGGIVVEPIAPRRTRIDAETRAVLESVLAPDVKVSAAAAARLAGWRGVVEAQLPIVTPHSPRAMDAPAAASALVRVGNWRLQPAIVEKASTMLLATVDDHHARHPISPGIHRDALRQSLPQQAPAGLANVVLDQLLDARVIETHGHTVRRSGWAATVTPDQAAAVDSILEFAREAGLAAPAIDELPAPLRSRPDVQDLVRYLMRIGALVSIPQDRFLTPEHAAAAAGRVRTAFRDRPSMTPADFRDLFGVSRKYLIPLLEHLDRAGITVRSGDTRVLAASSAP